MNSRWSFIFIGVALFYSFSAMSGPADNIQHFQEEITPPKNFDYYLRCKPLIPIRQGSTLAAIDSFINTGLKVWKVIEDNKAVADSCHQFANALPEGVRSASQLEGFSEFQTQSYRKWGKNLMGITVYDITYTLIHRYNGNYNGEGRYLSDVTIIPNKVTAVWPYKVNVNVQGVSISNRGTRKNPIASILMELNMRIKNVFTDENYRSLYEFRADSDRARMISSKN